MAGSGKAERAHVSKPIVRRGSMRARVEVQINERTFNIVEKKRADASMVLDIDGAELVLETLPVPGGDPTSLIVRVGQRQLICRRVVSNDGRTIEAWVNDRPLRIELVNRQAHSVSTLAKRDTAIGPITVAAPMAGRIVEVKAAV